VELLLHKSKKILLINPANKKIHNSFPHLGLAMLSAMLKKAGHQPLVLDYLIFPNIPSIDDFMRQFEPDVVGVSIFSASFNESAKVIETVKNYGTPIIIGGPHVSIYAEDLTKLGADYIVKGEAELVIVQIIENASKQQSPRFIQATLPNNLDELPFPDFESFYDYKNITSYPLLTSRGCPYNCSFCCVSQVSSRKWRPRNVYSCIVELRYAIKCLPKLQNVEIMDDNPTVNIIHFKRFLKEYIKSELSNRIRDFAVANIRADRINKELIELLEKAGVKHIAIGVEHGDGEVFSLISKGETLGDIKSATQLIKSSKIKLGCCFIIGLPADNFEKTMMSVKLAKELDADYYYWNMLAPYKGTRVREWFEKNGTILRETNEPLIFSGTSDSLCPEPYAYSNNFSPSELQKAFLYAMLETDQYKIRWLKNPLWLLKLLSLTVRHHTFSSFTKSLLRQTMKLPKCEVVGCERRAFWRKKGFWLCFKHARMEVMV